MYKLILLILFIVSTGHTSPSDFLDLNDIADPDLRNLYEQASDSYEQKSLGKALLYYKDFIEKDNDSPFSKHAVIKIDRILDSIKQATNPDAMYKNLSRKHSILRQKICFETAKNILENYPSKKIFFATKKLLKKYLSDVTLRLKVSYVADIDTKLKYLGLTGTDASPFHKFSFGNKIYLKKIGDRLLFYKLTNYDTALKEIELTHFDSLPYLLLQKNEKETLRKFRADVTHIILQKTIPAYFYLDSIEKKTGQTCFGSIRENSDSQIFLDFPIQREVKTGIFNKDDISSDSTFSVSDEISVYEKHVLTFDPNNKNALYVAKLNRFVKKNLWTEALGLYYLLEKNNLIDSSNAKFQAILTQIRDNILIQSTPNHLLEKGLFYLQNDCFLSGWEELVSIINTYPFAKEAVTAHNLMIEESRKTENNFFITSASPIFLPINFMGYNESSDGEELFQINYKKRSYFLKKDQAKGGFRITDIQENLLENFNPDLNALDKKIIRHIKVESEYLSKTKLTPNKTADNGAKVYFELHDRLTGKTYPGYMVLDKITKTDGTIIYGTVNQRKKDYLIYQGLETTDPVVMKKQKIQRFKIKTYQDKDNLKYLEKFLGKINFSELIKYYALEKQQKPQPKIFSDASLAETPKPDSERISKNAAEKEIVPKKKKKTAQKKKGIQKKDIPVDKKNDTNIFNLKLRKLLIKALAVLIVTWLFFMGYKMFKSMR